MNNTTQQIRAYRLGAHSLDSRVAPDRMLAVAGACGLQNTPPGAWETAMHNRIEGCSEQMLSHALYEEKSLLQAWSYRGVPVVFPTADSDVFLTALQARDGEQPWIYTLGISGALDYLHMSFDDVLARVKEAALYLDGHTIKSKEALDKALAEIVEAGLPDDKRLLWRGTSMYDSSGKQTVGEAAVSFLLRPCSFASLVVFGRREGISPTFTSYKNWLGSKQSGIPGLEQVPVENSEDKRGEWRNQEGGDGNRRGQEQELVRRFLRCYGPATTKDFTGWLGCSTKQGKRLWGGIAEEMEPVQVGGKNRYILSADMERLRTAEADEDRLLLLGPHDPYLDLRDRAVILEDKALHKAVWKYVGNPGVVLKGGRIAGIWKTKTVKGRLDIQFSLFDDFSAGAQKRLEHLSEEYAHFRGLRL